MSDRDDRWTTWISATPELDNQYRGCLLPMLYLAGFILAALVLLSIIL
jgi:hypothetical protein